MLLAPTEAEEEAQADEDLRKKLALEGLLVPKIRTLLDDIGMAAEQVYSASGYIITGEEWDKRLELTLREHYGVVQDAFGMKAADTIGSAEENSPLWILIGEYALRRQMTRAQALRDLERINSGMLDEWAVENAKIRGGWISATTRKELDSAFSNATAEAAPDASRSSIARTGRDNFMVHNEPRADVISATETQVAAESAKRIDLDAVAIFAAARIKAKKTWRTRGDNRVRAAHAAANGQTVGVNDMFRVGGELLSYPADSSHGASVSNTANCRCSAIYSLS